MKRLSAKTYAQVYYGSASAVSANQLTQVTQKFLQLLRRHRAMKLMPRIMVHLQHLEDVAHKKTRVNATAVDQQQEAIISKQLTSILGPVVLDLTVDPSLRGGLVLRVGDDEIDGSLRTRLRRLHQHLIHDAHA